MVVKRFANLVQQEPKKLCLKQEYIIRVRNEWALRLEDQRAKIKDDHILKQKSAIIYSCGDQCVSTHHLFHLDARLYIRTQFFTYSDDFSKKSSKNKLILP